LNLSKSHVGSLSSSGSVFQTVGPATGKGRRPFVPSRQRLYIYHVALMFTLQLSRLLNRNHNRKCYSAISIRLIVHYNVQSFGNGQVLAKSRSRMKVPDVMRNLIPDTWTADGEGALPEL